MPCLWDVSWLSCIDDYVSLPVYPSLSFISLLFFLNYGCVDALMSIYFLFLSWVFVLCVVIALGWQDTSDLVSLSCFCRQDVWLCLMYLPVWFALWIWCKVHYIVLFFQVWYHFFKTPLCLGENFIFVLSIICSILDIWQQGIRQIRTRVGCFITVVFSLRWLPTVCDSYFENLM